MVCFMVCLNVHFKRGTFLLVVSSFFFLVFSTLLGTSCIFLHNSSLKHSVYEGTDHTASPIISLNFNEYISFLAISFRCPVTFCLNFIVYKVKLNVYQSTLFWHWILQFTLRVIAWTSTILKLNILIILVSMELHLKTGLEVRFSHR